MIEHELHAINSAECRQTEIAASAAIMEKTEIDSPKLSRFAFCLVDEIPGPSQGDAAELIEALGINPWAFTTLDIVSERTQNRIVTTQFAVTGPEPLVSALREAFPQESAGY